MDLNPTTLHIFLFIEWDKNIYPVHKCSMRARE